MTKELLEQCELLQRQQQQLVDQLPIEEQRYFSMEIINIQQYLLLRQFPDFSMLKQISGFPQNYFNLSLMFLKMPKKWKLEFLQQKNNVLAHVPNFIEFKKMTQQEQQEFKQTCGDDYYMIDKYKKMTPEQKQQLLDDENFIDPDGFDEQFIIRLDQQEYFQ